MRGLTECAGGAFWTGAMLKGGLMAVGGAPEFCGLSADPTIAE